MTPRFWKERHIVTIHDTKPPGFVSAVYNATDEQVRITFDERIITPADRIQNYISEIPATARAASRLPLPDTVYYHSDTLIVNLKSPQNATFGGFGTPQLDIDAGAVSDESGNLIAAAPDQRIDTDDAIAPSVKSVEYDTNLRLLLITFNEPVAETGLFKDAHPRFRQQHGRHHCSPP